MFTPNDRMIGWDIKVTSHPNWNVIFMNIQDRLIWRWSPNLTRSSKLAGAPNWLADTILIIKYWRFLLKFLRHNIGWHNIGNPEYFMDYNYFIISKWFNENSCITDIHQKIQKIWPQNSSWKCTTLNVHHKNTQASNEDSNSTCIWRWIIIKHSKIYIRITDMKRNYLLYYLQTSKYHKIIFQSRSLQVIHKHITVISSSATIYGSQMRHYCGYLKYLINGVGEIISRHYADFKVRQFVFQSSDGWEWFWTPLHWSHIRSRSFSSAKD